MNILCWYPVLTDHQAYTIAAIANSENLDLKINVFKNQDPVRKQQGWTDIALPILNIKRIPERNWLFFIIHQLRINRESIHFFGSPFDQPRLMLTLFLALFMRLKVYIISEPYSPVAFGYLKEGNILVNKLKKFLRPLIYKIYGKILKNRLLGVFAISTLAIKQYRSIGIEDKLIYPFGYFVPSKIFSLSKYPQLDLKPRFFKIIFVGTLIKRKGLDILIDAARKIYETHNNFEIDIYGHGNEKSFDFNYPFVKYMGEIKFGHAQSVIANYDLFVLPSRYDGWGVVINEAILAGVPVVCSNKVGASILVKKSGCGLVYDSDLFDGLYLALLSLFREPLRLNAMAHAATNFRKLLSPEIAASYMIDSITITSKRSRKPVNYWY
jgi:glycosyltransferase involved in cell wall biosynthesis